MRAQSHNRKTVEPSKGSVRIGPQAVFRWSLCLSSWLAHSSIYTYSSLPLITWCLTAYLCACDDDTIFYSRFSLHIYQYTCSGPCTPLDIHYTTRWGVSDSPGSAYLDLGAWNLELEACGFSQLLIRDAQQKRGSSADRPELFPFSPLLDSRVFLL